MRDPLENQHAVSHKKFLSGEHQFWGSFMVTLSSFIIKFRSCGGKLIKIKQKEKHFVKISIKGLKMTLACWIWTIWTMSTTMAFVGICHTSCLPKFGHQTLNCPSIRYIVLAKTSPAFQLCQKNWFCGKVCLDDFYLLLHSKSSSWIHIGIKRISQACCLHHLKDMEKNCKGQLWDEKQNRALFWTTLYVSDTFSIIGLISETTLKFINNTRYKVFGYSVFVT